MDIRELYALGFSRFLSVTRLLNDPVPRDFKLFAIQTVSLAVTIWRRSASGKISGFFTKPSLFDRFTLFRTEMTKTETRGISSAKWILLTVVDYSFGGCSYVKFCRMPIVNYISICLSCYWLFLWVTLAGLTRISKTSYLTVQRSMNPLAEFA